MYFSQAYGVDRGPEDDWFDPILNVDTPLFIDPFFVFRESEGEWADADDILSSHFQRAFELLAGHHLQPQSIQYRKTVGLMVFPEPAELGLGYVSKGTNGAGTAVGFAKKIVKAMSIAIEAGLQDLRRFEELGLLVDRIGPDRVSDITCNLLKVRLISYTQEICIRRGVPMQEFVVKNAVFDEQRMRWVPGPVQLPENPLKPGSPVLLVPERFLNTLPTLNGDDWFNFVSSEYRDDLNWDIGKKLRKEEIIDLARQHPEWIRNWSDTRAAGEASPYDVARDPEGLHDWQRHAQRAVVEDPLSRREGTEADLSEFVRAINMKFKHFVEERGGWELLHNDDTGKPKRESSIQLLYRGIVMEHCLANNIVVDRETNLGRGPVDFAFTQSQQRVLMEVKKFRNGDFWNGLEHQLTSYLRSEGVSTGWFLAIRFSDSKTEVLRDRMLRARTQDASEATGFALHSLAVDARRPPSASNISDRPVEELLVEDEEFPS
ncbi:hypothetical protein [Clavibacter nebraskensis]|uniref:hypothetical protein n=1 Tax=Clavibacter nebraskensis TaxID=31963 RepID=UPI003F83765C